MSGLLRSFSSRIVDPLDAFQRQLAQIAEAYRSSANLLLAEEASLTSYAEGPSFFAGLGANSFITVCKAYDFHTEQNAQFIDQAVQATRSCIDEIWQVTNTAEMADLNDKVVIEVLTRRTFDTILSEGGAVVKEILDEIVHDCAINGNFFGLPLTNLIVTAAHAVINVVQDMIHLESEVWTLLGELPIRLIQWAGSIHSAISHYTNTIKSLTAVINFIDHPTLSNLYGTIPPTEGTDTPITKTPLGNNTILVTIAGLDPNPFHSGYLNNWPDAIGAGTGDANNRYTIAVEKEIQQYLSDHHLPSNAKVIIAGHSLGGMIAQYIYQASKEGKTSYSVSQIITFGSPQVIQPDQNTHEYINIFDPVPLLSLYNLGHLKELYAGETIISDEGNSPYPLDWLKNHDYSNSPWLKSQYVQFPTSQIGQIQNYP